MRSEQTHAADSMTPLTSLDVTTQNQMSAISPAVGVLEYADHPFCGNILEIGNTATTRAIIAILYMRNVLKAT